MKTSRLSGVSVTAPIGSPAALRTGIGAEPTVMGVSLTAMIVSTSPGSASLSFCSTSIVIGVSSGVVAMSSPTTGVSLSGVTLKVSVFGCGSKRPVESWTEKVRLE